MFFVYILKCKDGSFYTGITSNLKKRMNEHKTGKGSKYVRSRLPFELVYFEKALNKSEALKREHRIKSLTRKGKMNLVRRATEGKSIKC